MPPWIEKESSLSFESSPIDGLKNLDGNQIARKYGVDWADDKKYPLIAFPSGVEREILLRGEEQSEPHIHIFGKYDLPYQRSRDEAYEHLTTHAASRHLHFGKVGEQGLLITNLITARAYGIVFDNEERRINNIELYPKHAMELVTGEIRAALPPLYSGEAKGTEVVAPVKFFTPDANWTWYATEFDGQDLFFGLVSGFELELGYFSLTELESIRGGLNLPIERDLYYKPQTLEQLHDYHKGQNDY